MDNPFGDLLLQLQARIQQEVLEIREIAEDKGQLESYDIRPAVSFPCVLIDFDFKFDDMGENTQMATGDIIVRLAFPPFSSSSSLMPSGVKTKALAYADYEMKLYAALQGWRPSGFSPLGRRAAVTEKREDALRVRELRFDTAFEDYSAQDAHQTATAPTIDFSAQITNSSVDTSS